MGFNNFIELEYIGEEHVISDFTFINQNNKLINNEIEVYAESFVALNGRPSQRFIDPEVNLYAEVESFKNKTWVLPLNDEIKGF